MFIIIQNELITNLDDLQNKIWQDYNMKIYKQGLFTGERALYDIHNAEISSSKYQIKHNTILTTNKLT